VTVAGKADTSARPRTADDLRHLVAAFETATLPSAAWTHEAHITVACWLLLRHGAAEGTARMSAGIRRLNAAHGSTGYHETITRFYCRMIERYLDDAVPTLVRDCAARFADRALPARYYSHDVLTSPEARHAWVEPDRQPLD